MGEQRISRYAVTQESNGSVKELVRQDPWTIGYMSMGLAGGLKSLSIAHVEPKRENVLADEHGVRKYKLVRPFLFVTRKGQPVSQGAMKYIRFVLSPRGGEMLEKEGLIAPRQTAGNHS